MNRMRMWKRLIAAGTLALGIGAVQLLAEDQCFPELWAYADQWCGERGYGAPARECTYSFGIMGIVCQDEIYRVLGF